MPRNFKPVAAAVTALIAGSLLAIHPGARAQVISNDFVLTRGVNLRSPDKDAVMTQLLANGLKAGRSASYMATVLIPTFDASKVASAMMQSASNPVQMENVAKAVMARTQSALDPKRYDLAKIAAAMTRRPKALNFQSLLPGLFCEVPTPCSATLACNPRNWARPPPTPL